MSIFKKKNAGTSEKAPRFRGYGQEQVGKPGGPYQQEVLQSTLIEMEERAKDIYAPHQEAATKRQANRQAHIENMEQELAILDGKKIAIENRKSSLPEGSEERRRLDDELTPLEDKAKRLEWKLKVERDKAQKAEARLKGVAVYEKDLSQLLAGGQPYRKSYARRRDELIVAQQGMNLGFRDVKAALRGARSQLRLDEATAMRSKWMLYREQKIKEAVALAKQTAGGSRILAEAKANGIDLSTSRGAGANPDRWDRLIASVAALGPKEAKRAKAISRDLEKVDGIIRKWDEACATSDFSTWKGRRMSRGAFRTAVAFERAQRLGVSEADGRAKKVVGIAAQGWAYLAAGGAWSKVMGRGMAQSMRDGVTSFWGSKKVGYGRIGLHGAFEAMKAMVGMVFKIGQVGFQVSNQLASAMSSQDIGGVTHFASGAGQLGGVVGQSYLKGRQQILGSRGKILERLGARSRVAGERNRVKEERQRSAAEEHDLALSNGYAHLNNVVDYLKLAEGLSTAKTSNDEERIRDRMLSAKEAMETSYQSLKQYPSMARILGFDGEMFHPGHVARLGEEIAADNAGNIHDYIERAYEAAGLGIPSKEASHGDYQPVIDLGNVAQPLTAKAGGTVFEAKNTRLVAVCQGGEIELSLVGTHQGKTGTPEWGNSENALGERLGRMSAADLGRVMEMHSKHKLGELLHPQVLPDSEFQRFREAADAADQELFNRFGFINRDEVPPRDLPEFDRLAKIRTSAHGLKSESECSAETMDSIMADRKLHAVACKVLGIEPAKQKDGRLNVPVSYKPVGGGEELSASQVNGLITLAKMHQELGGFGLAQYGNEYHRRLINDFNETLRKGLGSAEPLGLRVRAEMRKDPMVRELDEAMRSVTQKNGPEFIRLFNQLTGVMHAQAAS
jgi:hypothetical protein